MCVRISYLLWFKFLHATYRLLLTIRFQFAFANNVFCYIKKKYIFLNDKV